jgi:hypothetical protein
MRLAEGLPVFLYACPECGAVDGLHAEGHELRCNGCVSRWTVGIDHALRGQDGATHFTLTAAFDAVQAHLGSPRVADVACFEADGTVLREESVQLFWLPRGGAKEPRQQGTLRLTASGVELGDWSLDFEQLLSLNMGAGNVLHLRTDDGVWEVAPASGATWKWENFIRERKGLSDAAHQPSASSTRNASP